MLKRILLVATLLLLFEPTFADDGRVAVKLPDMMREHMLGNMRDHLVALEEINYKDRHSLGTTWTAVLKITQSTTRKTYRFQKINNDFRLKVEFNLKSRFPGIAARNR
jgi:hypothetical protein